MIQSSETNPDGLAVVNVASDLPHAIIAEKGLKNITFFLPLFYCALLLLFEIFIFVIDNDVVFISGVKIFVDVPEKLILWHVFDDKHMYRPKDTVRFLFSFLFPHFNYLFFG